MVAEAAETFGEFRYVKIRSREVCLLLRASASTTIEIIDNIRQETCGETLVFRSGQAYHEFGCTAGFSKLPLSE